jgi:phosphoglycolate phosphatase
VIFDLDGTLVDTADEFVVAVQQLLAHHGRRQLPAERVRATVSNGAAALVTLALEITPSHSSFESERARLLRYYNDVLGSTATLFPGIDSLLSRLAERHIGWGIATNKPRVYTDPLLTRLAVDPAPGSVVCPDDVAERKPHPESLYRNCRELGCRPYEAVYVGDHRRDIEAGRRAGMYTVAAHYGYIEPGDDPDSWGADAGVACSTHLAALLLNN